MTAGPATGALGVDYTRRITTSSQSIPGDKPSGVAVGDLLVAVVGGQQANLVGGISPQIAAPASGAWGTWTRRGTAYVADSDSPRPLNVWTLPITDSTVLAALPSSWTWTTNASAGRGVALIRRWLEIDLTDPVLLEGAWGKSLSNVYRDLPGFTLPTAAPVLGVVWAQMSASTFQSLSWATLAEIDDVATISGATNASHSIMGAAWAAFPAGTVPTERVTPSATAASANGYQIAFRPLSAGPTPPTVTAMRCEVHRGINPNVQPASAEESKAGLATMVAAHPGVHGIEVDARVSSDGVPFLCHDADLVRVFGDPGSVETKTAAQLDALGVTRLADLLEYAVRFGFPEILVQHYTAATTAAVQPIVDVVNASLARSLVTIMTSVSTGPAFAALRSAGWAGSLGCYGFTAANWATHTANVATYGVGLGFVPPGDSAYTANRAHVATMIAAGLRAGASTVDTLPVMQQAHADGCAVLLTNRPDVYLAAFDGPDLGQPIRWSLGASEALELLGVWNGSSIDPVETLDV